MSFGGIGRFSRGKSQTSGSNTAAQGAGTESNNDIEMHAAPPPSTDPMWMQFDQPAVSDMLVTDDAFGCEVATDFNYSDSFSIGHDMESFTEAPAAPSEIVHGNTGLNIFKAMTTEVTEDPRQNDSGQDSQQGNTMASSRLEKKSEKNPMQEQPKQSSYASMKQGNVSQQPPSGLSLFSRGRPSVANNQSIGVINQGLVVEENALNPKQNAAQWHARPANTSKNSISTTPTANQLARSIPQVQANPNQSSTSTTKSDADYIYHDLGTPEEDPPRVIPVPRSAVKTSSGSSPPVQPRTPINGTGCNTGTASQAKNPPSRPPTLNLQDPSKLNGTPAGRTPHTEFQLNKSVPVVTPGPHSSSLPFSNDRDVHSEKTSETMKYGAAPSQGVEVLMETDIAPEASFDGVDLQTYDKPKQVDHSINDMDFDDLHPKFLSDIRDLEDLQNGNSTRLLTMEGLFATVYSESLHDQAKFFDLLEQLEKASGLTDEMISRFQKF